MAKNKKIKIKFLAFAERNDLTEAERPQAREAFFSKGQPCFRASPLTKIYGFGIQSNSEGKIALYGMKTKEYQQPLADTSVKKVKAMKSATWQEMNEHAIITRRTKNQHSQ